MSIKLNQLTNIVDKIMAKVKDKTDAIEKDILQVSSQIDEKANLLSARMDTFTTLAEGSTTGDAELKDIRVGANGTTYENAGNAVREQFNELKEDLDELTFEEIGKNLCDFAHPFREGKYVNTSNGEINNNSACNVTQFMNLTVGETYTVSSDKYLSIIYCNSDNISWNTAHTFEKVDIDSTVDVSNNEAISGYTFTATTPYIIMWYPLTATYIQVENGVVKTDYEPYRLIKKINELLVVKNHSLGAIEDCAVLLKDYTMYDQAYIRNNMLVSNNDHIGIGSGNGIVAKYTCVDMGETLKTIKCKARFYANGGSVALVIGKVKYMKSADVSKGAIHIVFTPSNGTSGQCYISYFKDGTNIGIATKSFEKCVVDGSVEYEFGFTLNGNDLTVYMPDGTTQTFTDPDYQTVNGRYVFWEHYTNGVTETNDNHARLSHFYAECVDGTILMDDFLRADGAIGIAPTGQVYWQFRNGVSYN